MSFHSVIVMYRTILYEEYNILIFLIIFSREFNVVDPCTKALCHSTGSTEDLSLAGSNDNQTNSCDWARQAVMSANDQPHDFYSTWTHVLLLISDTQSHRTAQFDARRDDEAAWTLVIIEPSQRMDIAPAIIKHNNFYLINKKI